MTRKLPLFAAFGLALAALAACDQTQSGGTQATTAGQLPPPPADTMTPAPATPPVQTAPAQ
ncbi:exported hypothetical protein [Mesorhizobium prunaredense]|uniref:Immunogenic protein (Bcsp31-1) n=1 Tax=Mesorhizobium prunaredense TaxID=1631249 RepID=A0A1R3V0N5_9HYPH|nr:exported hypothetical protein [Mesorhizobium prunaredense]